VKQARLDLADAIISVEYQRFILFQLWGDVALGVDQGLLADVFLRRQGYISMSDLDIVAKDLVVADLERLDSCALAFNVLQVGNPIACVARGFDYVIQFAGEPAPDNPSGLQGCWRFIVDG